jgi:hypothetical protein
VAVEVRDVAPGLWLWRQPHPEWREGLDWEPEVASFAVESRGVTVLLDPLAPPPNAREVWTRLDDARPDVVVILKPDHVRDVDLFVRWYGTRAPTGLLSSGVTTSRAPSSSRCARATSSPAGCVPSTTAAA